MYHYSSRQMGRADTRRTSSLGKEGRKAEQQPSMIHMPPPAGNNLFDDSSCWRGSARGSGESAHAGTAASKKSCNTLLIRLNYPILRRWERRRKGKGRLRQAAACRARRGAYVVKLGRKSEGSRGSATGSRFIEKAYRATGSFQPDTETR